MLDDAEAQNYPARGRYQLSVPPSDPTCRGTAKSYFARIFGNISGSRKSTKDIRKDKSRISRKHHEQGWMPAENGADGDSDSADEFQATPKQKSKSPDSPISMTMSAVSLATLSFPNGFPPTPSQLSNSSFDASSSVRFDPHGIRGLSYADQLPSSTSQVTMPSIQSQLYSPQSPQSSQSFLSSPSQMATTLSDSLERTTSPASTDNDGDLFLADPRPPLRTFESGSKFIEEL